jgi:hypothetical protein
MNDKKLKKDDKDKYLVKKLIDGITFDRAGITSLYRSEIAAILKD